MKEKSLVLGSTLAAFVASLCCLGPLVLGGVGLGAVLVATFTPLRPYFLGVSAVLLALGFYFVHRTPKAAEVCEGEVCATDSAARRWAKPILWLATLAVAALVFFPLYGAKLVPTPTAAAPTAATRIENVELSISGMVCEACAGVVKAKLLATAGVAEAQVDYPAGRATVKYDPAKTDPDKLVEAVNSTGYKGSLPNHQGE
jgi:copper chaperone CopZ